MQSPSPPPRRVLPSAPLGALAVLLAIMSLVGLARAWRAERPPTPLHEPPRARLEESATTEALREGRPLDVNHASAEELQILPRVGPALAARIVEARPFASVDDLVRVRGIGARTLERLRPLVTAGDPASLAATPASDRAEPPP